MRQTVGRSWLRSIDVTHDFQSGYRAMAAFIERQSAEQESDATNHTTTLGVSNRRAVAATHKAIHATGTQ